MKTLSAKEQRRIEETVAENQEAVCWAFETAKRIVRANIPIDFSHERERVSMFESRSLRDDEENKYYRYRIKVLGKDFDMKNKEDRGRLSGFLEHYEMNEEARLVKEAHARDLAERKKRGDD